MKVEYIVFFPCYSSLPSRHSLDQKENELLQVPSVVQFETTPSISYIKENKDIEVLGTSK